MKVQIFKFQRDMTGERVLAYPESEEPTVQLEGDLAETIYEALELQPLTKCYADAGIDENGLLHIYSKVSDQPW